MLYYLLYGVTHMIVCFQPSYLPEIIEITAAPLEAKFFMQRKLHGIHISNKLSPVACVTVHVSRGPVNIIQC